MSDTELTVHDPAAVIAGAGSAASLGWTREYYNAKGVLKYAHHNLRLTPAMLPMLAAAMSALLTEQASLATCFDGDDR